MTSDPWTVGAGRDAGPDGPDPSRAGRRRSGATRDTARDTTRGTTRDTRGWSGDVHRGVEAWLGGAAAPEAPDPVDTGERDARGSRRRPAQRSRWTRERPADPAEGPDADPESVARTILLDQLTGRARSRQELSDKLASRQVPEDVADRVLDRFEEVGLVDDTAFARTWVAQRGSADGGRGLARRALAQELRRKGVDDETAREVLDEVDPAEEERSARQLVRRKLRSMQRLDDTTATRRLAGMLARKGYSAGLAFAVVRDELADAGRDQPEPEDSL